MCKLSEQVAELERQNAAYREGWMNDLQVAIRLAKKCGEPETVEMAKTCLANLELQASIDTAG